MKKSIGLLAAVACAAVAGWASATLAAFPEPGDTVSKENMAQAKDSLTPTAEWMINQGMVMKVGAYRNTTGRKPTKRPRKNMPAR